MNYIIGVDECGYGAFAGPLVVCAFKAPVGWTHSNLKDSKDFSSHESLSKVSDELTVEAIIRNDTKSVCIVVNSTEIVKFGIGVCRKKAFIDAFMTLYDDRCEIICDGNLSFKNEVDKSINVKSIIKADSKIPTVMAASIIGKNYRNKLIEALDKKFPQYNFIKHQGYGTKEHKEAILKYGFCELHRTNYKMKGINV